MRSNVLLNRKNLRTLILIILSVLIIEILGFNFRHWMTIGNKPYESDPYWAGEGLASSGDNTYTAGSGSYNLAFHTDNTVLKAVYMDIRYTDSDKSLTEACPVELLATDEGHYEPYSIGSREIYAGEEISKYTLVRLYGKAGDIILSPKLTKGDKIYVNVILNPVIPLNVSPARMAVLFILFMLIWALRPASSLYGIRWIELGGRIRLIICSVFVLASVILLGCIAVSSTGYHTENTPQEDQYQKLAEALSRGSVSLLDPVDERLINLDNPYDPMLRYSVFKDDPSGYRWDNAYRNGKYYVYFGVVPVIIFYLPFYLITGTHIHNFVVCLILLTLLIIGYMLLLNELIRRYNRECSVGMWLISSLTLFMGSFIIYAASRPDHYNIPILNALVFGIYGMWAFLRSTETAPASSGNEDAVKYKLNNRYLLAGSLLTALITGCRPQLFIFIVFDIIILKEHIFSRAFYKSREGRSAALSIAVPMAIVALLIMSYNYLRFGSVIDFGASYNLTLEDLIHRGFDIRRGIVGIITILFSPIRYTGRYPFIDYYIFPTSFIGQITQTATPGSIFMVTPMAVFSLLSLKGLTHKTEQRNTLTVMAAAMLISAVLICMLDTIRAGVFERYYMDIATFISLSAIFMLWNAVNNNKNAAPNIRAAFINVMIILLVFEAVFFLLSFMLVEDNGFISARPDLFYHLKYLWEFYL